MFVYTVSLAYLTLYAVALHRTFEAALRNTDKNGSIRLQLLYRQIHHAQREDRERTRTARKHLLYYLFFIQSFDFM